MLLSLCLLLSLDQQGASTRDTELIFYFNVDEYLHRRKRGFKLPRYKRALRKSPTPLQSWSAALQIFLPLGAWEELEEASSYYISSADRDTLREFGRNLQRNIKVCVTIQVHKKA